MSTTIQSVKDAARRSLDGMTINRDKFAREAICVAELCEELQAISQSHLNEIRRLQNLVDSYDAAIKMQRSKASDPFGDIFGSKR